MNNDLIVIMSTLGQMSFTKFKQVYDVLLKNVYGEKEELENKYDYYDILGKLEALGHCEIDYNNKLIIIYPPSLVLLPNAGIPTAMLIGGRTEKLIEYLYYICDKNSDKIRIIERNHPGIDNEIFPPAIFLEATNKEYIKAIANRITNKKEINIYVNVIQPFSLLLLLQNEKIDNILVSLEFQEYYEPNWDKKIFSPVKCCFVNNCEVKNQLSLRLYTNPITGQQITMLWKDNKATKINRNWGRFIVLKSNYVDILLYDEINQRLAVPSTIKLPKSFTRTATFCSGFAPRDTDLYESIGRIKKGTKITIFEGVSKYFAIEISKKLGQKLTFGRI